VNKASASLFETFAIPARSPNRRKATASALALLALLDLSGCAKTMNDVTGSIGMTASARMPTEEGALRRYAEEWGRKYDANRRDKTTAMTYARALHALGQDTQAVAVLQGLAIQNPEDMKVLAAYGKALADAGRASNSG